MIEELLSQLDDPDPKVRRNATKELRAVQQPVVLRALLSKLADSDEIVRRNASMGLGNWDKSEIAASLLSCLHDPSFEVRCAVIQTLGKFLSSRETVITAFRCRFWELENNRRGHKKRGAESKEWDILFRTLTEIDTDFEHWREEQHEHESELKYLDRLETTKMHIDQSDEIAKREVQVLKGLSYEPSIRREAARKLGSAYFYRYILAYLFSHVSSIGLLPGKSLPGTLVISVGLSFESWAGVASAFNLRFKAEGGVTILEPLLESMMNDPDPGVRYECTHILRILKDEHATPSLRVLASRFPDVYSDEGNEARDALSEIEAADRTIVLPATTGEEFIKLAAQIKQGT